MSLMGTRSQRYQRMGGIDMDIGIIGSGHIGSTLARHLAALGHKVSIANSRGPASLAAVAADTGAAAATVEQAARAQDVIIIAVPEKSVRQLPRGILAVTSAVVVDAGNYYPSRDGRIGEIDGSLPGKRVGSAGARVSRGQGIQ
jgi:8-hydroxy-5-deazaflavin:NADPH oxidoreductase